MTTTPNNLPAFTVEQAQELAGYAANLLESVFVGLTFQEEALDRGDLEDVRQQLHNITDSAQSVAKFLLHITQPETPWPVHEGPEPWEGGPTL